jgi:NAD(P)-dependent dehydrogenase (short-subunit alcohol dehydrogenase family)
MSDIILILGAGPNVGFSLVKLFSAKGFKTAIASRSPKAELSAAADLAVKADFEDPSGIKAVFKEVREKLGVPNVVVYNGPFVPVFYSIQTIRTSWSLYLYLN